MANRVVKPVGGIVLLALMAGCMIPAAPPQIGVARSLDPEMDLVGFASPYAPELGIEPPLRAGLVWAEEGGGGGDAARKAQDRILAVALRRLRGSLFEEVAKLDNAGLGEPPSISSIRSVAARSGLDTALLLSTSGLTRSGWNLLALGYVGVVTAPLFPGSDVSAGATAELCAVDVRSGTVLGCGIGTAYTEDRYVFPLSVSDRRGELAESGVTRAVEGAVARMIDRIERRLGR